MIATRMAVASVLMMTAALQPLPAQQAPLTLGQWVRVAFSDSGIEKGHLILVVGDSVVIAHGERQVYVALSDSAQLQVPRRTHSHPILGAVVGAGVGLGVGTIAWYASAWFSGTSPANAMTHQDIGRLGRKNLGALIGLGIGALVGAHIYTTRWEPVPQDQIDRLKVSLAPLPRGRLGLGGSLTF